MSKNKIDRTFYAACLKVMHSNENIRSHTPIFQLFFFVPFHSQTIDRSRPSRRRPVAVLTAAASSGRAARRPARRARLSDFGRPPFLISGRTRPEWIGGQESRQKLARARTSRTSDRVIPPT